MSKQTRRDFIKGTLAAAATVTIAGTKSSGQVVGANDTINIGVAGIRGRGGSHVGSFAGMNNVRVTWLVDPDTATYESRIRQATRGGNRPQTTQDVRRALEDRNLNALSIATPNHWHSLMSIWACQAGKDVYVEKPLSHNVREGRVLVDVARRERRIVQHGTQSRSSTAWANAVAFAQSGRLGRLLVSRGLCYKPRGSIGQVGAQGGNIPETVDYNQWCGPAPVQRPMRRNRLHYDWHWTWDYGNGDMGNQGVHQMDIAFWAIGGAARLPQAVLGMGGRFGYEDDGETANTQVCVFDYGQTQLIFEVRGLGRDNYRGQRIGNIFHCEEGVIVGSGQYYPRGRNTPVAVPRMDNVRRGPGGGNHFANFIAAVRSRRQTDLNADVLQGHISSALCHLGNISYRLGQEVPFNPRTNAVQGNEAATETLQRMEAHLTSVNVRLQDNRLRVGPRLTFNAERERFTGAGTDRANGMLTRDYRRGFTLPRIASS